MVLVSVLFYYYYGRSCEDLFSSWKYYVILIILSPPSPSKTVFFLLMCVDIERSTSGSTNTSMELDGPPNTNNNNAAAAAAATLDSSKNGSSENDDDVDDADKSRQTSDSSAADPADIVNDNGDATGGNNNNTTSANNNGGGVTQASSSSTTENKFEASDLLLGIAENLIGIGGVDGDASNKRDPSAIYDASTLPSSMTSFLDLLTEDQRRKRHRHIPAVDGFRRLYKNEIKVDMAAARVLNRKRREFNGAATAMDGDETMEDNNGSGTIDDENLIGGGDEGSSDNEIISKSSDDVPDKMAFIVPSEDAMALANGGRLAALMVNTPFETSGGGGVSTPNTGTGSSKSARSPQLVDSLTAFNPPRPQESTASKTKHRLKRWEANPSAVEADLSTYRKTVQRTREELQAAENERGRIELVSAVMREQFQKHLIAYKEEIMAVYDQLLETNMGCMKAEERYNIVRSMSLRGSGKSMKDVLTSLSALEDELKNAAKDGGSGSVDGTGASSLAEKSLDWRVPGIGGVCAASSGDRAEMASGWILKGDNVTTLSGEEGEVMEVKVAPASDNDDATKNNKGAEKPDPSSEKKDGEDAMDVDKPKDEGETKDLTENPVEAAGNDVKKSADAYALVEKISVRLSNGDVKVYKSSELKFNPKKPPKLTHFNKGLAKRWEAMLKTAETGKHSHDFSAMDNYINASFATDDSDDGNNDTALTSDDQLVVPFGSDLMAAPETVRTSPSVIPPDTLEETVRKVVYETTTPRIIPDVPADLKKYEYQKEELNRYQATVMQLRHRLGRQKRLRILNERTLKEGRSRSHKVENLLLEMQMDLKNLKDRLHGELSELGISNAVLWNGADDNGDAKAASIPVTADSGSAEAAGLINNVEQEPESKRLRVE